MAVFPVVIPDNMRSIVITAENTAPRFNDTFMEYAQSRGFLIDAARVATPTDKPRVERVVHYVQNNFFAGRGVHRPGRLPGARRDLVYEHRRHAHPRDDPVPAHRVVPHRRAPAAPGAPVRALRHPDVVRPQGPPRLPRRSGQGDLLGAPPAGRAHAAGQARLVHAQAVPAAASWSRSIPASPQAAKSTDPADMPTGTEIYATRDIDRLGRMAADHGPAIGRYAAAILDTPLPWTKHAPGLPPLGAGQEVGTRAGRAGL